MGKRFSIQLLFILIIISLTACGQIPTTPAATPSPSATITNIPPTSTPSEIALFAEEVIALENDPYYFTAEELAQYDSFKMKEVAGYAAKVGIKEDGTEKVLAMEVMGVNEKMVWARVNEWTDSETGVTIRGFMSPEFDGGEFAAGPVNMLMTEYGFDFILNSENLGLLPQLAKNLKWNESVEVNSKEDLLKLIESGELIQFFGMKQPEVDSFMYEHNNSRMEWEQLAGADLNKPFEFLFAWNLDMIDQWPEEVQAKMLYLRGAMHEGKEAKYGSYFCVAPDGHLQFFTYNSGLEGRADTPAEEGLDRIIRKFEADFYHQLITLSYSLSDVSRGDAFGKAILGDWMDDEEDSLSDVGYYEFDEVFGQFFDIVPEQ